MHQIGFFQNYLFSLPFAPFFPTHSPTTYDTFSTFSPTLHFSSRSTSNDPLPSVLLKTRCFRHDRFEVNCKWPTPNLRHTTNEWHQIWGQSDRSEVGSEVVELYEWTFTMDMGWSTLDMVGDVEFEVAELHEWMADLSRAWFRQHSWCCF